MLQHTKALFLLMLSALLFVSVNQSLLARGGGGFRGGGEDMMRGGEFREGSGYYNRSYPNAARAWENRGLYWDSYGNEVYAPPSYNTYPYTYPYNPSYYPNYEQPTSPQYEQQPSDPEAATFPYHPV